MKLTKKKLCILLLFLCSDLKSLIFDVFYDWRCTSRLILLLEKRTLSLLTTFEGASQSAKSTYGESLSKIQFSLVNISGS